MKTNQSYTGLFWINRSKIKNGKAPVYCRLTINGKRSELSMQRSIDPDRWNANAGKAKGNSEEAKTLNAYLTMVENSMYSHHNQLRLVGKFITSELLKNVFLGIADEEQNTNRNFQKSQRPNERTYRVGLCESNTHEI